MQGLPPPLDLNRVIAIRQNKNPWTQLEELLKKHAKRGDDTMYSVPTYRMAVKYGKSSAVLLFKVAYLFMGAIQDVTLESITIKPNKKDPPGYENAIHMTLDRGNQESIYECRANITLISKKPSHGVMSGGDALSIALGLCKKIGCNSVYLYDASNLPCGNGKVPLRRLRILTRGSGWYESHGFKSIIEVLQPTVYQSNLALLHKQPLAPLMEKMGEIDAIIRAAIATPARGALKRMRAVIHKRGSMETELASPPSMVDLTMVLANISTALEVMQSIKAGQARTLGEIVIKAMDEDCNKGSSLINALLPNSDKYIVLTADIDGKPVPQIPHLEAWLYAWRISDVNSMMLSLLRNNRSTP